MNAKRVASYEDRDPSLPCYYKEARDGVWYLHLPNGLLANLANHNVVENPDGTITATPSILVTGYYCGKETQRSHGYLTNGEWKEC